MKAKDWLILSRAVEEGVTFGWNRAFKHTSTPEQDVACDHIAQEVLNAISEVFDFDDVCEE